jgi:hypothetical protein
MLRLKINIDEPYIGINMLRLKQHTHKQMSHK